MNVNYANNKPYNDEDGTEEDYSDDQPDPQFIDPNNEKAKESFEKIVKNIFSFLTYQDLINLVKSYTVADNDENAEAAVEQLLQEKNQQQSNI